MAEFKLKPWQRVIKTPSEAKATEFIAFYKDVGLVASDMANAEYLKHRDEKIAARKKRKADAKAKRSIRIKKMLQKRDIKIAELSKKLKDLGNTAKIQRDANKKVKLELKMKKIESELKKL